MPIAGPARSIPEDAIAAEVAAATAVSKKMSCGRKRAYLSVIAACLAAAALCACQSSEPGRKTDSESSNLKVLKPYSGNQTFSQKKVLEILSEQEKFFDRASLKSVSSASDTISNKRRIDSLWKQYLLENPKDVEARILCAKFQRACGDNETAYVYFKEADEMNPGIAVVKQQMSVYEAESGAAMEAYKHIEQAVAIEPDVSVYNLQAAQTILFFRDEISKEENISREELDKKMMFYYRRAAELAPGDSTLQWKYAQAFYDAKNADWNEALKQWDFVLKNCVAFDVEKQTAMANKARVLIELNRDSEAEAILAKIDNPNLSDSKNALLAEIIQAKLQNKDDQKN